MKPREGSVSVARVSLRVLIVGDSIDFSVTLAESLRRDGHDVSVTETRKAALDVARRDAPDVVLIDLGLRDGDGYPLARTLRHEILDGRSAILAFASDKNLFDRLHDHLVDLHLTKPLEIELLPGLIQFVLNKRRPTLSIP